MMEVMLDSKDEFLESKRSCQGSGFNFFQAILSGLMVRAKRREEDDACTEQRCLEMSAMKMERSDGTM